MVARARASDLLLDALELDFENQRGEGRNAACARFSVSQGVGDDEFVFGTHGHVLEAPLASP